MAYLEPGDVLYLPAFWGHQTFSGAEGPSVSLATWLFPAGGDPLGRLSLSVCVCVCVCVCDCVCNFVCGSALGMTP